MKHLLNFCFLTWLYIIASESTHAAEKEKSLFCATNVCNERAKLINESLNNSADPCLDFYTFACGGFERNEVQTHAEMTFGIYDMLLQVVDKAFKDILDKIVPQKKNQIITDKVGLVYNACLAFPNVTATPAAIAKVLESRNLAGWPMLEIPKNDSTAMNTTDMLLKIGLRAVFDLSVERDQRNPTSRILQLRYPEGKTVDENNNKNAIKEVARFLRPSSNETDVAEFSERVASYGRKLKNLKVRQRDHKDRAAEVVRVTIRELQTNFSNIPLLRLLNQEFSKVNTSLTENDTIELHTNIFYENLSYFLLSADPIDVFNYAGARVMYALGEHISEIISQKFPKTRSNRLKERWQVCTSLMRKEMPEILDSLFVQDSHNASVKAEVKDTANRIKEAFHLIFLKNKWIKTQTRKSLLEKLKTTTVSIGYPMVLMNRSFLEALSEDIPPIDIGGVFFEIWNNISESHYRKQLKMLHQPWDPEKLWMGSATAAKALYSPLDYRVEIPWALLRPPAYRYGLPRSLTFGGIGSIIAHEFARAFSIEGTPINVDGEHENTFGDLSEPEFEKIKECFVSQYGNISVRIPTYEINRGINGFRTLGENIIDNVGLRAAFNAYNKFLNEDCDNTDTRLEALKSWSGQRLFFIAFGMQSCKLVKEMDLWWQLSSGSQSPPRYRVNEPLRNLEDFSTVFGCEQHTAMNRNLNGRCQLW